MGIDATIETEDGQGTERVLDVNSYLGRALGLPGVQDTVCLRFIDPYGDTVFNQLQIPVLITEFETLRRQVTDAALRRQAVARLEAAKQAGVVASVVQEYVAAVDRTDSRPVVAHLDAVLELARKARGEVHTYLKFYGD